MRVVENVKSSKLLNAEDAEWVGEAGVNISRGINVNLTGKAKFYRIFMYLRVD